MHQVRLSCHFDVTDLIVGGKVIMNAMETSMSRYLMLRESLKTRKLEVKYPYIKPS